MRRAGVPVPVRRSTSGLPRADTRGRTAVRELASTTAATPFLLHIVVPAYGKSPYLRGTLSSALVSADEATVVTVVDDGSPDDEVRQAASSAGDRVEYVRLERNLGVAGAFQACLELSRGEYTVFLGSDDVLQPTYVSEVRRLVDRHAAPTMVLPGVVVVGSSGDPVRPLADRVKKMLAPKREILLQGDRLAASLLTGNWLYFPAIAWRTQALRRYGFRQDMQTALDLDLELRIVFDGGTLAWSPAPAFTYRRHAESASSRTAKSGARFAEEGALFTWAQARARELGWPRSVLAARWHPTARLHAALVGASTLAADLGATRAAPHVESVRRRRPRRR